MGASWVAASVRARLLGERRRLGRERARALAASPGLNAALLTLAGSPYGGRVEPGMSLADSQRQVAATALWNLRLLAGWLPPGGTTVVQPMVAWFELANLEDRLAVLGGASRPEPFELGRLEVAWRAASRSASVHGIRAALSGSYWGDPGTSDPAEMVLALRLRWAAWMADSVPGAGGLAVAGSALLAARLLSTGAAADAGRLFRLRGLPHEWRQAGDLGQLARLLPRPTAWVLDGIDSPEDLWKAEGRWWERVEPEGRRLRLGPAGPPVIAGTAALLAHDAWLVRAALAAAAGGRAPEAFDALA